MSKSRARYLSELLNSTGDIANTSGNLALDVAADIVLDAAGNDIILKAGGTTFGQLTNDTANLIIYNQGSQMLKGLSGGPNAEFIGTVKMPTLGVNVAPDASVAVKALQSGSMTHAGHFIANGDDIAVEIQATASGGYSSDVLFVHQSSRNTGGNLARFANSDGNKFTLTTAGAATFAGNVQLHSSLTFGYNSHYFEAGTNSVSFKNSSGTSYITINSSGFTKAGDLTLDASGDIHLDADGGDINFKDGGTTYGFFAKYNNDLWLGNSIADADVAIRGNDSARGGNFTALSFDMSDRGKATFNSGITAGASTAGDWGLTLVTESGDNMKLSVIDTGSSGSAHGLITVSDGALKLKGDDVRIENASGNNIYKAVSNSAELYHNGSKRLHTSSTGVVVSSPAGSGAEAVLDFLSTNTSGYGSSYAIDSRIKSTTIGSSNAYHSKLQFYTNDTSNNLDLAMTIDESQQVGIGTSNPGRLLELYGTSNPALRLNNGTDTTDIGIAASAGAIATSSLSGALVIARNGANAINLATNGNVRATVDSSGNVLVGSSTADIGGSSTGVSITQAGKILASIDETGFYDQPLYGDRRGTNNTGTILALAMQGFFKASIDVDGTSSSTDDGAISFNTIHNNNTKTERMRIQANGYLVAQSASQVRLVLGSTGNPTNNTSNWIRGNGSYLQFNSASDGYTWEIGGTPKMTIDSNGKVGIGATSPATILDLRQTNTGGTTELRIYNTDNSNTDTQKAGLFMSPDSRGTGVQIRALKENADFSTSAARDVAIAFYPVQNNNRSEAGRFDSSRNFLVGDPSATWNDTAKTVIRPSADNWVIKPAVCESFNRTGSDGDIFEFYRGSSSKMGTIASYGSTIQFGQGNVNLRYDNSNDQIIPANENGSGNDDALNLGAGGARFDNIYATNGTIQTSDRNEKQDIEELSDAEQRVAVACKGLLRKFRWKSSVADKGDDARIHFGIIAQDLQAAFEAEGLDAGRYAMFISSTWTDEDGNERTRMGVRYSELLAFIIAAI